MGTHFARASAAGFRVLRAHQCVPYGGPERLAYRRNVLTWDGSLAAFVVGMVIGIFGDVTWLFLLLFFLLSSFLATRYRFALKAAMAVQEGIRGERRSTNVLANGVPLMPVAVLSLSQPPADQPL